MRFINFTQVYLIFAELLILFSFFQLLNGLNQWTISYKFTFICNNHNEIKFQLNCVASFITDQAFAAVSKMCNRHNQTLLSGKCLLSHAIFEVERSVAWSYCIIIDQLGKAHSEVGLKFFTWPKVRINNFGNAFS